MSQSEPRQFWSAAIYRRFAFAIWSAVVIFASPLAHADDESLKHALALEATIQQIVKKAEPSVACILVSRSNEYARLNHEARTRRLGPIPTRCTTQSLL